MRVSVSVSEWLSRAGWEAILHVKVDASNKQGDDFEADVVRGITGVVQQRDRWSRLCAFFD